MYNKVEKVEREINSIFNNIDDMCSSDTALEYNSLWNKYKNYTHNLENIVISIRDWTYLMTMSKNEQGNYRPIKNVTRHEVYYTFNKIRNIVESEYVFKPNYIFLEELLEEENFDNHIPHID